MDLIGKVIEGKYKILSVLGSGGAGTVYKAEQEDLARFVALKVLHKTNENSDDRLNLIREAKNLLAGGQDSSIIKVLAVGVLDDDSPYLVMEYVEGQSLDLYIQQHGPLDALGAMRIGLKIAQALSVAHENKIVHRDLKPANILIGNAAGENFVKVLDFGLSKNLSQSASLAQRNTATGAIVGSIAYMAPEVCSGQQASERSDIYALGCILYECLRGQSAFVSDNILALLNMHRDTLPEPLRDFRKDIPEQLELVVFKCLQKNPEKRFSSAKELVDCLNSLIAGRSLDLTVAGVVIREIDTKDPKKANSLVLVICVGAAFVAVLAVGVYFSKEGVSIRKQSPEAVKKMTEVTPKKRLQGINAGSIESRTRKMIQQFDGIAVVGSAALERTRCNAFLVDADGIIKDTKKAEILYLAWFLKGRTFSKLSKREEALDAYNQAVKYAIQSAGGLEPFQAIFPYSGIIHEAEQQGKYEIAENAGLHGIRLLEARAAGKDIPLIDVPLDTENNRALNFFGLAVEKEFYFRLARAELALHKLKEARLHAEKALGYAENLDRGTVYIRTVLAEILMQLKESKLAMLQAELCERLLIVERQDVDRVQANLPQVSAIFSGTADRSPKTILEEHRMLANYYLRHGYKSDAVRIFKIAIEFAKAFNLSSADIKHMQLNLVNLDSQLTKPASK